FEYRRRRVTAPLLQGVLVLATGTNTPQVHDAAQLRQGAYATVALEAAPEDAVKLVAARQSGTITAVLRRPTDTVSTRKPVRGDLASLLEIDTAPPPAVRKKIPVIYGNKAVTNVPGLVPGLSPPRQNSGLFDLPYAPELVSAWMQSVAEANDGSRVYDVAAGPVSQFDAPAE